MSKKFYIGCSGYYYAYWKNRFYPKDVAPKNWLAYYSTVFDTVELNGTFYRTPKPADLQRYAAVTGDDFTFSVKMSRFISHIKKLKECTQEIGDFQQMVREAMGGKLQYFLFQMPPSFHYNEENMERIMENIPHHKENVIELRHSSWWNEETKKLFTGAGFTFCNVDMPGLNSYFMHTSDVFYLRLHGNPELFKSPYSNETLMEFYNSFPKNSTQYNIYFNNTYYEAGYTNAQELMNIIKTESICPKDPPSLF